MDKLSHSNIGFGIYLTIIFVYVLIYFKREKYTWTAIFVFAIGKEALDYIAYGGPSLSDIKNTLIPLETLEIILPRIKEVLLKIIKKL